MNNHKKILLLGGNGLSTRIVYHRLSKRFASLYAIIEERETWSVFLKRRIKKLGIIKVIGQIFFHGLIVLPLMQFSKKRKREIFSQFDLEPDTGLHENSMAVKSINDPIVIEKIKQINPDIIIVNGTRIISRKNINQFPCIAINTHAGITPKYRGVHGTYWALANNDPENSGVTIHQVDVGIDTGKIISQTVVKVTNKDNFTTYPLLQLGAGLILLEKAINDHFNGTLEFKAAENTSKLWYHPTLLEYIKHRVFRGVR